MRHKNMGCKCIDNGVQCTTARLSQPGGKLRSMCPKHFAASNLAGKVKKESEKIASFTPEQLEVYKKKKTEESLKRIQKSVDKRRAQLNSIENLEVQRIAQVLDRIKSKERYVIVPDVIYPLTLKDIKTTGPIQPITFGSTRPYKRTMQIVSNPEDYLSNVIKALRVVFSGCDKLVVKLLKSEAGDLAQTTHTDLASDMKNRPITDLSAFHYSALISFQKLLCHEELTEVDIPLYSMLLYRGDFPHAGAAYSKKNCRLFISLSSELHPMTDDILLHLQIVNKIFLPSI